MRVNKASFLLFLAIILATANLVAAAENSPIGKKIDDLSARDFRGKERQLADFADSKLVVVVFLGTECPLAKLYGPRLADLQQEFADRGVSFIGVDSNRQDFDHRTRSLCRRVQTRVSAVEGRWAT